MNVVNLIGRTTKDIEIKTNKDRKYIQFSIAVYRDKNNTDFISCVAFDKTAETLEKYVKRGEQVGITGRLQVSKVSKDGKDNYITNVIVNQISLLSNKDGKDNKSDVDEELPFS